MRVPSIAPSVLAVSALALSGCVSSTVDHDGTILTPSEANRIDMAGAVTAPLRDTNLVRTKIPSILLAAKANPYARPAAACPGLVAEVRALNEALGADLDEPPSEDGREDLLDRGTDMARSSALGFVAGTAQDLIPMRSWVRKLSGAERHDRLVNASITAGGVRRAYLKGLGEARGCNPPGTPRHKARLDEPKDQRLEPRYPIR